MRQQSDDFGRQSVSLVAHDDDATRLELRFVDVLAVEHRSINGSVGR